MVRRRGPWVGRLTADDWGLSTRDRRQTDAADETVELWRADAASDIILQINRKQPVIMGPW